MDGDIHTFNANGCPMCLRCEDSDACSDEVNVFPAAASMSSSSSVLNSTSALGCSFDVRVHARF
jgi:hypothetical protein